MTYKFRSSTYSGGVAKAGILLRSSLLIVTEAIVLLEELLADDIMNFTREVMLYKLYDDPFYIH
jgi:hypothetical protein